MSNRMPTPSLPRGIDKLLAKTAVGSLLLLLTLHDSYGQVPFEGEYEQHFETLPAPAPPNNSSQFIFTNNKTILGWYTNRKGDAIASIGVASKKSEGIYAWVDREVSTRALGTYLPTGFSPETAYLGVQLQNTSGKAIESLTASYVIQQWRRGEEATTWNTEYLVTSSPGDMLMESGYIDIPAGRATSRAKGQAGSLQGSRKKFQQRLTIYLDDLKWEDGGYLWLRWSNSQEANAAGLGMTDIVIKSSPGKTPS